MQIYGISEREMTPAELFEDFHRMMGLRNKISNALMAIGLFEVKSTSANLSKYIRDGLSLSEECVSILDEIVQNYEAYQYQDYTSKVLMDILTNRPAQELDKTKLVMYKEGFLAAQEVFQSMQDNKEPDPRKMQMADQVMQDIDKEIESTYANEENLYRGSFIPRSI